MKSIGATLVVARRVGVGRKARQVGTRATTRVAFTSNRTEITWGVTGVKKIADPPIEEQEKVTAYFQSQSSFWNDIYTRKGVYAEIHRNRHATILEWIESQNYPPNTRVLEIGCGAGYMAVALAQLGLQVHAIDPSEAMVAQAQLHSEEAGLTDKLSIKVGDTYALEFEDDSFDLVLAVGVIPWLDAPELAMQEMARVTKPGGCVLLTADNRARLNVWVDPWLNPVLQPLKRQAKKVLKRTGLRQGMSEEIDSHLYTCRYIDNALINVGLTRTRSLTLGFGPFTLFRQTIIPESLGVALHHRLQLLSERNVPGLRSSGSHYIVLAQKSLSSISSESSRAAKPVSDALSL